MHYSFEFKTKKNSNIADYSPYASGEVHSHSVTGGEYKAQVHIHRGMLIRDY